MAATRRPNILLVVLDTTRADHLPPHDDALTPQIADAIEASGAGVMLADRVYANAPWTLPSHASLLSGATPTEHGIHGGSVTRPDHRILSLRSAVRAQGTAWLPEAARADGYRTFGVSANPWISEALGFSYGFESFESVGPGRLGPRRREPDARGRTSADRGVVDRTRRTVRRPLARVGRHLRDLRGRADHGGADGVEAVGRAMRVTDERPFFGLVNLMEAHVPYAPPRAFNELRGSAALRWPTISRKRRSYANTLRFNLGLDVFTSSELSTIGALYRGEIRYLDALVGSLLAALPRDRETIVVLTADHGEALGEEHVVDHQLTMVEGVLRVPFIVLGPPSALEGLAPPTSLRDVPELVAGWTGLDDAVWRSRRRVPEGVTVAEYESTLAHDRRALSIARAEGFPHDALARLGTPMQAAIEGNRKLLVEGDREVLLDVARPSAPQRVEDEPTRARLRQAIEEAGSVVAPQMGEELDEAVEADIEARLGELGYL